jgi:hypothetical protein
MEINRKIEKKQVISLPLPAIGYTVSGYPEGR